MCSYLHKAPNGFHYFRMSIPLDLRPFMNGKREIKVSLGLKDRDAAKLLIPDHTKTAHKLLDQARRDKAAAGKPTPAPSSPKAEPVIWESDPASDDRDFEIEALEPIMDAMTDGSSIDASPADILRAGQLLVQHEREMAEIEQQRLIGRMLGSKRGRASEAENQAVEYEGDTPAGSGKGIYLDTDIVDGWAAERKPEEKTKAIYASTAKLFHSLIGRMSIERITKADVLTFKRKLIEEGRSTFNVWDKLGKVRTLFDWAAQNDLLPDNPAKDVRVRKEKSEKRADWNVIELNKLLAGPVHAKRELPKGGMAGGAAAYWLPLLALFSGARREELGQLLVPDVKLEKYYDNDGNPHEAWCINITDNEDTGNRVKNASSRRLVPLHPNIIELGFIDYVQSLPNQKGQVFPVLKRTGEGQKLTDKFGQWFTEYRRKQGIPDGKVFHGLRHTWKTQAVDAGIPERVCRQFQGHEGKDVADKYGGAPSMHVLVSAIASYRVPGLKIPSPKPAITDTP